MRMNLSLWNLALAAFLSGCAGQADERIGSGPITLGPRMQAAIDKYLNSGSPGAFAMADNGAYGYGYCPADSCRPYATGNLAITSCETKSKGAPCYIYAVGTKVVWRGAKTRSRPASNSSKPNINSNQTKTARSPQGLSLDYAARAAFDTYWLLDTQRAFAVAPDSDAWGWAECKDRICGRESLVVEAINDCRVYSKGRPCRLYAFGREVVWRD